MEPVVSRVVEDDEEDPFEPEESATKSGGKKWPWVLLALILGLAGGYFLGSYYPYTNLIPPADEGTVINIQKEDVSKVEAPEPEAEEAKTEVTPDQYPVAEPKTNEAEVKAKAEEEAAKAAEEAAKAAEEAETAEGEEAAEAEAPVEAAETYVSSFDYDKEVVYPFGYGLSYSSFRTGKPKIRGGKVFVKVRNTGKVDADEVVQLYIRRPSDSEGPLKTLRGFARVKVPAGKCVKVSIPIDEETFTWWDPSINKMVPLKGRYEVLAGTSSAGKDLRGRKYNFKG